MYLTKEIQDALVQYALSFLRANINEEECIYINELLAEYSTELEEYSEEQIEFLIELTQLNQQD